MPWYPLFKKIESADVFVLLNHCQFEKNNFQNRFNMNNRWFTMSTNKGLEKVADKKYVEYNRDWVKIKKSLYNYDLDMFDICISSSLAKTNENIIRKICKLLNINTKIVTDYETVLTGTERLVDICKSLNATTYISGQSGKNYMDIDMFNKNNIKVIFQKDKVMFKKPILQQLKEINNVR